MKLNHSTRKLWAEKILDLVHIASGALIFGQFLSERVFSYPIALYGLLILVGGYVLSLRLMRKM